MSNIFNYDNIDFTKEPLFLGSGRNIVRLDLPIEKTIQKDVDKALGLMWFKNDYSYKKDGEDYARMSLELRVLFLKNLKFQTMADSTAARSVIDVFGQITTNPQLETWWYVHAFFEGAVHSPTYAEIIKALPVDAKKEFDDIIVNDNILDRARTIISCFEDTVKHNARMVLDENYDRESHKRSIILSIYALNILEAVLFKSSFITSFAFNENGIMTGAAKAVKKIALDEILHYKRINALIKTLRVDPEWEYLFKELEPRVVKMYQDALEVDYAWIDYTFPRNESINLLGINNEVLKQYVQYNMYNVCTTIKLPHIVKRVHNPCAWADKYSKLSNVQTAMKETDSSQYLLGRLNMDITKKDYKEMPL